MSKYSNKKLFSVELPAEEQAHGMELLEHFPGDKNGEKLAKMFALVEGALSRSELPTNYQNQLRSIDDSFSNIHTAVDSIVKASEERHKHDIANLQNLNESLSITIQDIQKEKNALTAQVSAAVEAKATAESAAAKAEEKASQLARDKTFYEAAARDKEDLNKLLRDKVASLESDAQASKSKLDALQVENDALRADIVKLKAENDALASAKEKNTANLDFILDSLNDPPV